MLSQATDLLTKLPGMGGLGAVIGMFAGAGLNSSTSCQGGLVTAKSCTNFFGSTVPLNVVGDPDVASLIITGGFGGALSGAVIGLVVALIARSGRKNPSG